VLDPHYVRPTSIDEAIAALERAQGDGLIVAGGVVVGSLLNQRLVSPAVLIDITHIDSLAGLEFTADGALRLGALVTHAQVLSSALVRNRAPLLSEIAAEISCPRLRNQGTLGGSLCTIAGQADPAAGLIALDARVHLRGPAGPRTVALLDFYKDQFTVDLEPGELLEAVTVPRMPVSARHGFCKLGPRKAMDFTQITAAVVVVRGRFDEIAEIRIGISGAGPAPHRPTNTEAALHGSSAIDWPVVASVLDQEINPQGDLVYSEKYKRRLAAVTLRRAVERALERCEVPGQ
jgi:aerobic carbon-monoxide dehydrogenase medium subunit